MWPDAEAALIPYLSRALGVRVCTDVPAALGEALPLVRVMRVGGSDDGFRLDRAVIDTDTFAATRAEAAYLATRLRAVLLSLLPGTAVPGAVFTAASTVSAPAVRPWENPGVLRCGATYALSLHTRP